MELPLQGVCVFKVVLAGAGEWSLCSMSFAQETEFPLMVEILEFVGFPFSIYFTSSMLTYLSLSFLMLKKKKRVILIQVGIAYIVDLEVHQFILF